MSDELDRTAASMRRLMTAEHPSAEPTLAAYVRGTLDPGEREIVDEHVAGCDTCREDVADLRTIEAQIDRRGRKGWLWIAAAIVVVAILALTLRRPQDDGYARAEWDALVRDARTTRALRPPPAWKALQSEGDVLRGTQGEGTPGTFTPDRTIVESQQPTFAWPAQAGAQYVVRISANGNEVLHSDVVSATRWTPPTPLARGITYLWQVDAIRGDRTTVIPQSPTPSPIFTVLDEQSASAIRDARGHHPNDHFLLGVLYARAGVREAAREELTRWRAAHPSDDAARALLQDIDRWTRY